MQCMPAVVPGTVLTSLVANGTFAPITDLFYEDSLRQIPDINDTGAEFYTFVYRTTFQVSHMRASCRADLQQPNFPVRLWLNLRGTVLEFPLWGDTKKKKTNTLKQTQRYLVPGSRQHRWQGGQTYL